MVATVSNIMLKNPFRMDEITLIWLLICEFKRIRVVDNAPYLCIDAY